MILLKKFMNSSAGLANTTLILSVLIALLIPFTIIAGSQRWELRRKAAEESRPLQELKPLSISTAKDLTSIFQPITDIHEEDRLFYDDQGRAASTGTAFIPEINGYIIQLRDEPLIKYRNAVVEEMRRGNNKSLAVPVEIPQQIITRRVRAHKQKLERGHAQSRQYAATAISAS